MTLNITLFSRDVIYQSADFRVTDFGTGQPWDNLSQKGIIVSRRSWRAVVAFAGVGHTGHLDVAEWLGKRTAEIPHDAPFEALVEALLEANVWLPSMGKRRYHTFTVGAFIGSRAQAVLVSNFESLHTRPTRSPKEKLEVSERHFSRPSILVTGVINSVSEEDYRRLRRLISKRRPDDEIHRALADANKKAAKTSKTISSACFTTHLGITGDGAGQVHGLDDDRPYNPTFLAEMFGRAGIALRPQDPNVPVKFRSMAIARSEPTDEFHRVQLKHKSDDPSVHSN